MTELTELDALATAAAIRGGATSAVEVAKAHLARAERLSAVVGAFARLTPDRALAEAAAVDAAQASGESGGPLSGVPCPIKDLNPVAGVGLEAGSAALIGNVAEADDDIVGWFREAGTVLLGKTSTPEFGLPCYTEPDTGPPARRVEWRRRGCGGDWTRTDRARLGRGWIDPNPSVGVRAGGPEGEPRPNQPRQTPRTRPWVGH